MSRIFSLAVLFVCLLLSLPGCSRGPELHPVKGKVVYADGSSVSGGTLICTSTNLKPRRSANAEIHSDGSFMLGTLAENDGVYVGKYQASVQPPALSEEEAARTPLSIDLRYSDPATAGISFEVKEGENEFLIRVTKPGKPAPTEPLVEVLSAN